MLLNSSLTEVKDDISEINSNLVNVNQSLPYKQPLGDIRTKFTGNIDAIGEGTNPLPDYSTNYWCHSIELNGGTAPVSGDFYFYLETRVGYIPLQRMHLLMADNSLRVYERIYVNALWTDWTPLN